MDINRSRIRSVQHKGRQPKAVDGFFVRPNAPRHPVAGRPATSNGLTTLRRVGDFGRTDGFYATPRRAVAAPAVTPQRRPAPAFEASHMSAQFEQNDKQKDKTKHGRRGRVHAAKRSKFKSFRVWVFRSTAVALVIFLAIGGLLFGKGYFKLKQVFSGSTSAAALQENVDPSLLKGEGDGRINILLLGVGGAAHEGSDLTDTMMIASVDPINNQAVLFSVPRDLWVKMPNNYISNYQKINAAYESGKYKYLGKQDASNGNKKAIEAGFAAADSTIERVIGVPIHYNVLIDFQAFKQAIDTVGGVTIDASQQLYDPTMAWENDRSPIIAKLGINNFDGRHALNYVRSRETTSDFARSQRQRAVMVALKDKVMNLGTISNPLKLSNLLSAFGNNVVSDISLSDMTRMTSIMKKIPNNAIQSVGLADEPNNFLTTGNINGLSVVQPRAGLEDYSKLQEFVRSKLKDGYIAQENAKVTVLNGTVVPGLATEKGNELKSYGYNVITIDNAPTPEYTDTVIVDFTSGVKKYTLNYLKNRYHVQSTTAHLPPGIVQNGADIVIILGQDATTTTSN